MSFRITGLDPADFAPLFALSDAELTARNACRRVVDTPVGFPCRVSLDDAEPGETVLLLNYVHQPAATPFQASHAIYVRDHVPLFAADNAVPPALRRRLISLRGFDADGWLRSADVVDGRELEAGIAALFEKSEVAYLHAHYAKMGCFAARVDRVEASAT